MTEPDNRSLQEREDEFFRMLWGITKFSLFVGLAKLGQELFHDHNMAWRVIGSLMIWVGIGEAYCLIFRRKLESGVVDGPEDTR